MKRRLLLFLTMCIGLVSSAWALEKDGDVYQISSAQDLADFAALVNGGETTANAVLTKDIDLAGVDWTPIGNASVAYSGTFDGQGYRIYGFKAVSTGNGGMFGKTNNATIKNFSIDGEFDINDGKYAGVIAQAINSTITNIHSSLTITITKGSHMGGVVGSTEGGESSASTTISNCSFSGSITFTTDYNGSVAGVVGYMSGDHVINCANYGDITFIATNCNAGGIVAYINNAAAIVENCLNTGKLTCSGGTPTYGAAIVGRIKKNYTAAQLSDNYWLEGTALAAGKKDNTTGDVLPNNKQITAEQLKSGEICYALNGSISGGTDWFQTIPDDDYPWPFNGGAHGIVYKNGRVHCDGTAYDGTSFSNENVGLVVDQHDFVNGFCSYCGLFDADYMTPNTDGYYEIGTPNQLRWFAAFVNAGGENISANAVLTDDIDMSGQPWENAIGYYVNNIAYKGHFNGQGYKIENLEYTTNRNYHGFFGVLIDGAVVENFSIYGNVINESYDAVAPIAYAKNTSEPVYIRNIHSYMNITSAGNDKKVGGILGNGNNGTTYVDRCVFSGTLSSTNKTNCGGIVAYIQNNATSIVHITNCFFDGKLESTISNTYCGGIVGYIGPKCSVYTITNCLSVGTFDAPIAGSIFGYVRNGGGGFNNNYYLGSVTSGLTETTGADNVATSVTTEQLESGEVAAKLAPAFRQNIGTDETPVLDPTHNVVAEITSAGYATLFVPETSLEIPEGVTAYTGTIDGEWLKLNPLENVITNGQAVVLKGNAGFYGFAPTDAGFGLVKSDLVAEEEDITADGTQYVLAKVDDKVGFYQAKADTKIAARKAYLKVPAAGVKGFTFAEESETAINEVNGQSSMVNGQSIYNLAGQRISKMQKGINIVNGKKVLK